MGTVADLVPLLGENRILAKHGLSILEQTTRPGLLALMDVSGIDRTNGLQPVDISFRLGPRINASGRLADAALSVIRERLAEKVPEGDDRNAPIEMSSDEAHGWRAGWNALLSLRP